MGIQAVEIKSSGSWFDNIVLSFDHNVLGKSYQDLKSRFHDIGFEEGEILRGDSGRLITIDVMSIKDYYYSEFYRVFGEFTDNSKESLSKEEKDLIEELFPRFCSNFGMFSSGFIVLIAIFSRSVVNISKTVSRFKNEIIHSDPEL